MLLRVATIALLPALIIQGYRVKKNTIRLPEPEGDRQGRSGQGNTLFVLILGDSAAAGVGVEHQDEALIGAILNHLQTHFEVDWNLNAKTGDTTQHLIEKVSLLNVQHFDVVITSVGVNDVTQLLSAKKWIKLQHQLYQLIEEKFSPKLILATGVPPMELFPALPQPLAWLFGEYARKMNQQLKRYVEQRPHMNCVEYDIQHYQKLNIEMAADGFHPSREIYQIWGRELVNRILAAQNLFKHQELNDEGAC